MLPDRDQSDRLEHLTPRLEGKCHNNAARSTTITAVIPVTIIPGWTDELTAVGTVAAAVVALFIALWSGWLGRHQREAEDARRQLAEAYQIQVETMQATDPQRAVGIIVNRSPYTVTNVDGQFSDSKP